MLYNESYLAIMFQIIMCAFYRYNIIFFIKQKIKYKHNFNNVNKMDSSISNSQLRTLR